MKGGRYLIQRDLAYMLPFSTQMYQTLFFVLSNELLGARRHYPFPAAFFSCDIAIHPTFYNKIRCPNHVLSHGG